MIAEAGLRPSAGRTSSGVARYRITGRRTGGTHSPRRPAHRPSGYRLDASGEFTPSPYNAPPRGGYDKCTQRPIDGTPAVLTTNTRYQPGGASAAADGMVSETSPGPVAVTGRSISR